VRRVASVAAIVLAVLLAAPGAGIAASTVEATGEAEVSLPPDQALLSLGVTTEASTAKQALDDNARVMTAVVAALAQAGFSAPDVATRAVSVTPIIDYQPQQRGEKPRIVGYRANNTVQVKTRDPSAIGRALDVGVQAGANVSSGIAFGLADSREAETQALRLAVQETFFWPSRTCWSVPASDPQPWFTTVGYRASRPPSGPNPFFTSGRSPTAMIATPAATSPSAA